MMIKIKSYFELIRFPNLFTSMADIMAGAWVALIGCQIWSISLILLLIASACLYGMGVVLNDYVDFIIDKRERPERPLPSGRVPRTSALILAIILGVIGLGLSAIVHGVSFVIALCLVCAILIYDCFAKHNNVLGPFTMGVCRSFNFLLGLSLSLSSFSAYWWLCCLGFIYIFTVTAMSKAEVGEGEHLTRVQGMALSIILCSIIISFIPMKGTIIASITAIVVFLIWTFSSILPALRRPIAEYIRPAVGRCIVGLPLLDAAIAAPFGGWSAFLTVALFLLLSYLFSTMFAVT